MKVGRDPTDRSSFQWFGNDIRYNTDYSMVAPDSQQLVSDWGMFLFIKVIDYSHFNKKTDNSVTTCTNIPKKLLERKQTFKHK